MKDKEKVYLFHGPYQNYFYKYVEYKRGTGRKYGRATIFMIQELERFLIDSPLYLWQKCCPKHLWKNLWQNARKNP